MAVVLCCPAAAVQTVRRKELAAFSGAADRCRQAGRTDWATYRHSKVCCGRQTELQADRDGQTGLRWTLACDGEVGRTVTCNKHGCCVK